MEFRELEENVDSLEQREIAVQRCLPLHTSICYLNSIGMIDRVSVEQEELLDRTEDLEIEYAIYTLHFNVIE